MVGDVVASDQVDKIPLRITREGGFGEMRVLRQEVFRPGIHIGEITAPAAGNTDLLARFLGVIQQQRAGASMGGGHQASGTSADYDGGVVGHLVVWLREKVGLDQPNAEKMERRLCETFWTCIHAAGARTKKRDTVFFEPKSTRNREWREPKMIIRLPKLKIALFDRFFPAVFVSVVLSFPSVAQQENGWFLGDTSLGVLFGEGIEREFLDEFFDLASTFPQKNFEPLPKGSFIIMLLGRDAEVGGRVSQELIRVLPTNLKRTIGQLKIRGGKCTIQTIEAARDLSDASFFLVVADVDELGVDGAQKCALVGTAHLMGFDVQKIKRLSQAQLVLKIIIQGIGRNG